MPVLFLSGEPRVGQSVSGVGDKECTSADSFNTIIDPMKSLPTFNYNYMPICVNNFMIKYTSLLGDPAFSLWCTTVFPLSERDNTFCYSLILSFLPHPFPGLMPARKNSEKKNLFYPSSRVHNPLVLPSFQPHYNKLTLTQLLDSITSKKERYAKACHTSLDFC